MTAAIPTVEPISIPLDQAAESFMADFQRMFPRAKMFVDGNAEGHANIEVAIFVPDAEMTSARYQAAELSAVYDLKTDYFIVPIVYPLDAYAEKAATRQ